VVTISQEANGMRGHALLVEDTREVREVVRTLLERAGLRVSPLEAGREALRALYELRPDVVILDVGLPGMDGWEVLDRIREVSDVPVLMLTGESGELQKVRGLRHGADDYVTKPFGNQELIARVEALLRRARGGRTEVAEIHDDGYLHIDFREHRVLAQGVEVDLTPLEFRLLAALAQRAGRLVTHDQLLELAWNEQFGEGRERVKIYVGYVRRKLDQAVGQAPIETVRGLGYRYRPPEA
jgi:DNA-binding response OmpR family regulator